MAATRADLVVGYVGRRVRFAPNPRWPDRTIEARVTRLRGDNHFVGAQRRVSRQGWLDTIDDAGIKRSVRPSQCRIVEEAVHG